MIHKLNLSFRSNTIKPISNLFKTIYKSEGNILRSHLLKSKDAYLVSLDASYPKKKKLPFDVYEEPKYIYFTYKNLLETLEDYKISDDVYPISLSLNLTDSPGIVHKTLNLLTEVDGEIYNFKSTANMAPVCSTRIFECYLHGALPRKIAVNDFKQKLNNLEDDVGCDILFEKL